MLGFHLIRTVAVLACLLSNILLRASDDKPTANPSFDYAVASAHEIKPHRRTIPFNGVKSGFNQLRLAVTVSPAGDVIDVEANGDGDALKFWPQLQGEVRKWKFTPFEQNGNPVMAEIEEYIDLVPPERLPKNHVVPPVVRPDSKISISLERTECFGTCPFYTVTVSTEGIVFDGSEYVVAAGKHTARVDGSGVRKLANRFVAADFYSMEPKYEASVTDNPTYVLSIDIDGHKKRVLDYVGSWEGMPAVITDLEDQVDSIAKSDRWIKGTNGLVQTLKEERFDFQSSEAQVMMKEAASRGQSETVQEFVAAGAPLDPLPAPPVKKGDLRAQSRTMGLLTSASGNTQALQTLLDAGASRYDQSDKDLALAGAAGSGKLAAVRALIAYGANPNVDLSKLTVTESGGGMTIQGPAAGSVLIYAARAGNPDVVREILRYHPNLEARDQEGKTAMIAVGDHMDSDKEGTRVQCVRLLAQAGARVNVRDNEGNTPLHEIYLTDVEEELLKLGADVNARNNDGETPIFTNVDDDSISLFIEHGADLTIRNNKGETIVDVVREKGPARQEAFRQALQKLIQK